MANKLRNCKIFDEYVKSGRLSQEIWYMNDYVSVAQLCPTLCDPMDCSPLDFLFLIWMIGVSKRVKLQQRYTANIKHYDAKFSVKKDFDTYACND